MKKKTELSQAKSVNYKTNKKRREMKRKDERSRNKERKTNEKQQTALAFALSLLG